MGDRFKSAGSYAFVLALLVGLVAIPVVFLLGVEWAAKHLLQPLVTAGWIALAIDVLVLIPLSIFRRLRGFTGVAIFISSYIFGLVTWLLSFTVTYILWGSWAAFLGVLLFGGTVVPFAILATVFNGKWYDLVTILILFTLTWGVRFLGLFIGIKERG
jgi:hypothetical protein